MVRMTILIVFIVVTIIVIRIDNAHNDDNEKGFV